MDNQMIKLSDNNNPHAMYNLASYYSKDKTYSQYYKQLYEMNYYRSFLDYAKELPYEKETLNILKKSIENGYYNHISNYFRIFLMINEIEDITKSPTVKAEFIIVLNYLIDAIIIDEIEILFDYIYMRKILIKHFNFLNEYKNYLDTILIEIINYLNKFFKGSDDENKNKINSYFVNSFIYQMLYTLCGYINFHG
jgi:hypothetical protein